MSCFFQKHTLKYLQINGHRVTYSQMVRMGKAHLSVYVSIIKNDKVKKVKGLHLVNQVKSVWQF